MPFEVVPIRSQNHEGDQYGWRVLKDGLPYLDCTTGGTGACWNVKESPQYAGEETGDPVHFCELDEAIAALTALRDSSAHQQNVARWAAPST